MNITAKEISKLIEGKLLRHFGREPDHATKQQFYRAACLVVRDILSEMWLKNHEIICSQMEKQVIYLSMEFLPGKSLKNNLFHLGIEDLFRSARKEYDLDLMESTVWNRDAVWKRRLGRLDPAILDAHPLQRQCSDKDVLLL